VISVLLLAALACTPAEEATKAPDTGVGDSGGSVDSETDPIEEVDETSLPQGSEPCRGPVLGTVTSVIDGDTIKVETGRGRESVRLIGINTPEVDHSGPDDECFGEESKAYLTAMIDGDRVWLTFDAECQDHFGRTLAYVHRGTDEHPFVQRMMLQGGWASAFAVAPNVSFQTVFESDERDAVSRSEGMWGTCR
jgi:endonuclease YncB( thermonuclease family)